MNDFFFTASEHVKAFSVAFTELLERILLRSAASICGPDELPRAAVDQPRPQSLPLSNCPPMCRSAFAAQAGLWKREPSLVSAGPAMAAAAPRSSATMSTYGAIPASVPGVLLDLATGVDDSVDDGVGLGLGAGAGGAGDGGFVEPLLSAGGV